MLRIWGPLQRTFPKPSCHHWNSPPERYDADRCQNPSRPEIASVAHYKCEMVRMLAALVANRTLIPVLK